jgi:hypothetical protein
MKTAIYKTVPSILMQIFIKKIQKSLKRIRLTATLNKSLMIKGQILKNRHHSWIGHTIRHNKFVVKILEGAISRKKGCGKTSTTILKASCQKHRS